MWRLAVLKSRSDSQNGPPLFKWKCALTRTTSDNRVVSFFSEYTLVYHFSLLLCGNTFKKTDNSNLLWHYVSCRLFFQNSTNHNDCKSDMKKQLKRSPVAYSETIHSNFRYTTSFYCAISYFHFFNNTHVSYWITCYISIVLNPFLYGAGS